MQNEQEINCVWARVFLCCFFFFFPFVLICFQSLLPWALLNDLRMELHSQISETVILTIAIFHIAQ